MLTRDLEPKEPKVLGQCAVCKEDIYEAYEYYEDQEKNMFCCKDCALKYYEVEMK